MSTLESLIARVDVLVRGDAVIRAKLETVSSLLVRSIAQCDTASVGIVLRGEAMTGGSFDHVALGVDLLQYRYEQGPCLDAAGLGGGGGHLVRIDLMDDERYQRFAPGAIDVGVTSMLSVPCASRSGELLGSLNLYSRGSGSFTCASEESALPFAGFVADLIEQSLVVEAALELLSDLTSTFESSAVVNQAIGLIMDRRTCTAEAALAFLGASATARRQDLPTVARYVVAKNSVPEDS